MLTKRAFLAGCCASACALDPRLPAFGQESMAASDFGCGVTDDTLSSLESSGGLSALKENLPGARYELFGASNDSTFDRILGHVLVRMMQEFSVYPAFRYYDDRRGANALATATRLPAYRDKQCDGTVIFGVRLLGRLRPQPAGDAAILAICAHEFGHVLAFQRRLDVELAERRLPRRPCFELHADFMAGYFLRRYASALPALDVRGAARAWMEMGSSDFGNPFWHGTTEMRIESIEAGYFLLDRRSNISAADAYAEGVSFMARYKG